ncbi:Hpt domain-containing protein [Jhaorihella thermophila]|uniref:Hpt domain-containing protein n=2 Tax=Jhaorihella thermophila TaxID=488547 RepID=A0A1H5YTC0_9RHOB|nr:Hpt domain-containing protein [Jhaorihella thermophila]
MDMNLGSDFAEKLRAMSADFAATLSDRRDHAEALMGRIGDGRDMEDAVREIGMLAHKLRGTAPTFGFADLGACATELEFSVQQVLDPEAAVDESVERFVRAYRALIREIERIDASRGGGA